MKSLRFLLAAASVLFSTLLFSQKTASADELLDRARNLHKQGRMVEAIGFYDEALAQNPNLADALFNRGAAFLSTGQYRRAIKDFDKLLGQAKHDDAAYELRAECYFMLADWKNARKDYEKAEKYAVSAQLFINAGIAAMHLDDLKSAENLAQKAIALDAENTEAWALRGDIFIAQKKYDEAIAAYEEVARRVPGDAAAMQNLGACHLALGHFQEALNWLNKSIQLGASAQALVNRGNCFFQLKNLDAALSDANRANQMDFQNADAYNLLGLISLKKGEKKEAISFFNECIAWDAGHPNARYNRAIALYETNEFQAAEADLTFLINEKQDDGRIRLARARVRAELKNMDGACEDFRSASQFGLPETADEQGLGQNFCR